MRNYAKVLYRWSILTIAGLRHTAKKIPRIALRHSKADCANCANAERPPVAVLANTLPPFPARPPSQSTTTTLDQSESDSLGFLVVDGDGGAPRLKRKTFRLAY